MYDHEYLHDHGDVFVPYSGQDRIPRGLYQEIQGPCPPDTPGEYKITIRALDENEVTIGKGSKTRFFPEEK